MLHYKHNVHSVQLPLRHCQTQTGNHCKQHKRSAVYRNNIVIAATEVILSPLTSLLQDKKSKAMELMSWKVFHTRMYARTQIKVYDTAWCQTHSTNCRSGTHTPHVNDKQKASIACNIMKQPTNHCNRIRRASMKLQISPNSSVGHFFIPLRA